MNHPLKTIFLCGGNEIATAIAVKLARCHFDVVMWIPSPENYLRYHLCFGDAVYQGRRTVEEVTAMTLPEEKLSENSDQPYKQRLRAAVDFLLRDRKVVVLDQPQEAEAIIPLFQPHIIVNALPLEASPVQIDHAPLVVGLYPFHQPGLRCHAAVETRSNYSLGAVYLPSGELPSASHDLLFFHDPFEYCQTPLEGVWLSLKELGDMIVYNQPLGKVGEVEIRSPYNGQIWGLAHSGRILAPKSPVALIFQGKASENYRRLGFKEQAIAGGVLEAVLRLGKI